MIPESGADPDKVQAHGIPEADLTEDERQAALEKIRRRPRIG
jgi:hypothetical protein